MFRICLPLILLPYSAIECSFIASCLPTTPHRSLCWSCRELGIKGRKLSWVCEALDRLPFDLLEPNESGVRSARRGRDPLPQCCLPIPESMWLGENCYFNRLSLFSLGRSLDRDSIPSGRDVSASVAVGIIVVGVVGVIRTLAPVASVASAILPCPTTSSKRVIWWWGFIRSVAPFVITREAVIAR